MLTRLVVTSINTVFPNKSVPSSGTVSDFESSNALIEEEDATYVMDRGYPSKTNLMEWQEKKISFVVRISKNLRLYEVDSCGPTPPSIHKDAKVEYGISKEPLRYIELDDKDRIYRIFLV